MMNEKYKGKILWLTDTFWDHNGVSMVLQAMHREIQSRDLPIDILVCSNTMESEPHLRVIKPVAEFVFPFYRQQQIRIPGFFDLRRIFIDGNYNSIICSTEGPMGMAALYLSKSFGVRSYFYIHTDWLMFARTAMKIGDPGVMGITRLLRYYYRRYDGLFVLNTDHQEWLTGNSMRFDPSRVFLTAHWADGIFYPREAKKSTVFGLPENTPVILYAGRISEEKGVMELPRIYKTACETIPGLKMVIAGTGPAADKLKEILPEAFFPGWVNHADLPEFFSAADLLILPSRFDTFSCAVLEAQSCGLPVIAYNTKGPKDIICHGISGFLANDIDQMIGGIRHFFNDPEMQRNMRLAARERGEHYNVSAIMDRFMTDVNMLKAG